MAIVNRLSEVFAAGQRVAILEHEAAARSESGPGLILLDAHGEIDTLNPAASRWIGALGGGPLPPAVLSVAAAARAHGIARAQVRTAAGDWLVLHGSQLGGEQGARTSVIIEPPRPNELVLLLAAAYGLTAREREITEEVLVGRSTQRIARFLAISPYTVQEHLTKVFDKVGVRSRSELVGQVFFRHCLPLIPQRSST
jgi:DNA-binding CsgD family transcriptional regulator